MIPGWLEPLRVAVGDLGQRGLLAGSPPAGSRRSAVLVLFGDGPAGPDVLLIRRAAGLRQHAGQPAFPGGAVDPADDGPTAAALREAAEETGLDPSGVRVFAVLAPLHLAVSSFAVTPVLAWWQRPGPVGPVDPAEVAAVLRVPLADLADPARRCRYRHPSGRTGPAFELGDLLVWGFTAAVLDRLLDLGGWGRPWDGSRLRVTDGTHPPQPGRTQAPHLP